MLKRLGCIVIVVSAAAVVGGCSRGSGTAVAGVLDPCREISDSLIREAGFNPGTKQVKGEGVPAQECSMNSPYSTLQLILLTAPVENSASQYDALLADAQARATATGSRQPELSAINGREAFTHPENYDADGRTISMGCSTALRTKSGVLNINVMVVPVREDSCAAATRIATLFEPTLGDR
ncbi:DUF3558 family protein [Nocardia sp. CDC160]|uniref:DUF3558 family protein n=1 Tax=Nocardia sp. CDC160 TaxID=3112166 RepID=UPI002DBC94C5|nr:DUF3558 family protein [Nocardia sp. CDC160]MEC3914486.1 DUF3558 family protein [Nocardia sp. CDC160]